MGRARLMEQQRAKIEARRAAKKKAAKTTKKVTEKIKSVGNSLTGNGAPKPSQIKTTTKKPAAKPTPKPAASKPSPKPTASKPTPKPTSGGGASLGSKLSEAEKKSRRIAATSVKTGSATQGQNMPSNPSLKSQPKKSTSKNKGASPTRKTGSNKSNLTVKNNTRKRSRRQNRRSSY